MHNFKSKFMHSPRYWMESLLAFICLVFLTSFFFVFDIKASIQAGFPVLVRSGNTNSYTTYTGSFTSGNCVQSDVNHNLVDAGGACTTGGGSIVPATANQTAYYTSTTNIGGAGPGTQGQLWSSNGSGTPPSFISFPHSISFVIDGAGSVIATGDIKTYPTADFACTINRIDISADQSGSITVDVWKAAGAIPTSGDKISASAPLTLSSAQLAQNGSRTGWTTAVSVGDVFGFSVITVATVTRVVGQIWCQ